MSSITIQSSVGIVNYQSKSPPGATNMVGGLLMGLGELTNQLGIGGVFIKDVGNLVNQ